MAVSSRTELISALARGDGSALLNTPESEWLDFKQAPYHLAQDDQKLELAKDVAALANAQGGLLVIGVATRREQATALDVAGAITPVRRDLVNFDSYRSIIENLTYPPVRNLDFGWWLESDGLAVLTIDVPAAADSERPVLVVKARSEGSRSDILLGIFERSGDRVARMLPAQIHAQLQLGRLLARGYVPDQPAVPSGPTDEERTARLDADTREAGLAGRPRYWLQAWPDAEVTVRDIRTPGVGGAASFLANPPQLREHGFGLRVGSYTPVTPVPRGGLRAFIEGHSVSLLGNGILTWVVDAGSEWLAWGDQKRGVPGSINPIALAEGTLEFCRLFINEVLPRCEPHAERWKIAGALADLSVEGESTRLASLMPRGWIEHPDWVPVPQQTIDVTPMTFTNEPPGIVAGAVLTELYAHLGIAEPGIPYVHKGEVNEDEIARL